MNLTSRLLSFILQVLNLLLAVCLTASAYGGLSDPSSRTFPSVLAMTFPMWLVLTLAAMTVNLFIARKAAIVNILSIIICIGPILDYTPIHIFARATATSPEEGFTLMTYNVLNLWDFRDTSTSVSPKEKIKDATLDYVMSVRPDMVAIQECSVSDLKIWEKKYPGKADSLHASYPYSTFSSKGGMGFLSVYPFETVEIPGLPETSSFAAEVYRIRMPGGRELTLINVHLQSIGLNSNDKALYRELTDGEARSKKMLREVKRDLLTKLKDAYRNRAVQARALRAFIDTLPPDVILCGDFNDIPASYSVRTILGSDMYSAFREAGTGPGLTYHADRFYFRIDHCLYRGTLTAEECRVDRNPSSDHYPLVTAFRWTAPPPASADHNDK